MKKRLASFLSFTALLSGLAVSLVINNNVTKANAYSINTKLPSTIDLNDASEGTIRNYYLSLVNLDGSERKGENLLKNLKPILSNGQLYYSYDDNTSKKNIWKMYEIVDRDWEKSPASEISGYNSTTNKITGYTYNTSDPYIHALYVNRDVDNQTKAWADHQQTQWGINQEHIWAKSHGFEEAGSGSSGGARGDIMHLWAGNGRVNGTEHNNFFYGYVDKTKSYTDPVKAKGYTNLSGNLNGKSKTLPSSEYNVFEPQDSDKGDIARAIFYMAARYNNFAGDDTIDGNNPNLRVVNEGQQNKSGYNSSDSVVGKMGILSDLLEWNRIDPPDEFEIHRNNLCYNNYTKNRNPFIDFPTWADYVWGGGEDAADPTTNPISDFEPAATVAVESISMDTSALTLEVDEVSKLTYTISPSNATDKVVTWTSSNSNVVSVDNGTITAEAVGSATITVRTHDGNKTSTCAVTVENKSEDPENVKTITISYSDTFDPALKTASSNYNTSPTLHEDTTAGIKFKEQGTYKGTSADYIMFYNSGSPYLYNTEDLGTIKSVSATYSSGVSTNTKTGVYFGSSEKSTRDTSSNEKITGVSTTDTWTNNTVGYGYFQFSSSSSNCQITTLVIKYTNDLDHLVLNGQTTEITQYGDFEFDGTVTAYYDNGTYKDVTPDISVSSVDTDTYGVQQVTVSYTEDGVTKSASYDLTINEYRAVEEVTVTPTIVTLDLNNNSTVQMDSHVTTIGSAVSEDVIWSSSDINVATVSSTGLVTAEAVGVATITATSVFDDSKYADCSITVINTSVVSDEVSDTLTKATTGMSGSTYGEWSGKRSASSAVYAGLSAGGNNSIQLRSSGNNSGIISTASGGTIKSVSVTWNASTGQGRKLNIYGSNTAYTSVTSLYDSGVSFIGSISYTGESTGTYEFTTDYEYVGVRSASNALYLTDITFTWTKDSGGDPGPGPDPEPVTSPYAQAPFYNGVRYKLYLQEKGYFNGTTGSQSYYGATSESYVEGVDVYFEQNGDGQNMFFYESTTKKYICIDQVISGEKKYINFVISETPLNNWEVDEESGDVFVTVNSLKYTLGLRSDQNYTTFSAQLFVNTTRRIKLIDTADSFSKYVLDKISCDSTGKTAPTFATGYSWSQLKSIYDGLFHAQNNPYSEKDALAYADADESGDLIEQAMAKYEYLVNKYSYENFIGRNIAPQSNIGTVNSNNGNNIIIIASLVGGLSILTLGLAILAKRKKEY